MSSYTILITKRFEKDLEICKKRELKLSLLYTVIEQLKLNGTLPKQYRAHKLSGNYANYWECHIKGDWAEWVLPCGAGLVSCGLYCP